MNPEKLQLCNDILELHKSNPFLEHIKFPERTIGPDCLIDCLEMFSDLTRITVHRMNGSLEALDLIKFAKLKCPEFLGYEGCTIEQLGFIMDVFCKFLDIHIKENALTTEFYL